MTKRPFREGLERTLLDLESMGEPIACPITDEKTRAEVDKRVEAVGEILERVSAMYRAVRIVGDKYFAEYQATQPEGQVHTIDELEEVYKTMYETVPKIRASQFIDYVLSTGVTSIRHSGSDFRICAETDWGEHTEKLSEKLRSDTSETFVRGLTPEQHDELVDELDQEYRIVLGHQKEFQKLDDLWEELGSRKFMERQVEFLRGIGPKYASEIDPDLSKRAFRE